MKRIFIKYLAILQAKKNGLRSEVLLLLLFSNFVIYGQRIFNNQDGSNSDSNETRLLDCESILNSSSKLQPPDLEIVFGNWTPMLKYSGNYTLVKKDKNEAFDINFSCKAKYPVHLLHELNNHFFDGDGIRNKGSWEVGFRNKVFYSDFYNKSDYEFYVRETMRFFNMKSQTFSCQSIENPCLQHTAKLSFSNNSSQLNIKLNRSSKLGYPLPFMNFTESNETSSSNETTDVCEAIYYYELVESGESTPTYKFRCEFSDGAPGLIQQNRCNNLLKCQAVQRYRPQQNGCWREYNATNRDCECCQYETATTFTAFAATCRKDPVETTYDQETSTSSLAFYGVPQGENSTRPEIFFSANHVNQSEMIYVKILPEEVHKLGSVLHVECLLSGYYTSAAFQFALEIEGQSELQLLPLSPEGETNWISSGIGAWKSKIDMQLNSTKIKKVYCFGQIQNKYEWINASRSIRFKTSDEGSTQFIMSIFGFGLAAVLLFVVVPFIFLTFIKRGTGFFWFGNFKWKKTKTKNSKPKYNVPYDKNYEVPRECIDLGNMNILDNGEFGVVIKGKLKLIGKNQVPMKTAVKMIYNVQHFPDFLDEISIMTHLGRHENIVCLLGACTSSMTRCEAFACLEYCKNGSLKNFLPKHKDSFENLFITRELANLSYPTTSNNLPSYAKTIVIDNKMVIPSRKNCNKKALSTINLLSFSWDIVGGMNYLTEKNVCHRDLAARNILITEGLRGKVGDFGLSVKIDQGTNYVTIEDGDHPPWPWLSPESLSSPHQYSVKSDVFSYGVLLYEIFSLGKEPWEAVEFTEEFKIQFMNGERMDKPNEANDSIYSLMLKCWNNIPSERPSFMEIQHDILQEIQKLSSTSSSPQDNCSYVDD